MCKEKKRYPLNGTFELTGRCNLSCKMCLVRVDQKRICELGTRERTAKEWIDMARQIRDAGTLGLLLTGGEVMLRPDFCEIYEAIGRMGFILTVYTNATMVTEKIMDTFRRLPPHKIGVTMYGASNETYEKVSGCADGYDRFVEGVRKLKTLPSQLAVRTTIIKDNLQDLSAMKDFVKQEFGTDKVLTINRRISEKVRGSIACPTECRLTPEQNIELVHGGIVELLHQVRNGEVELPDLKEKFQVQRGVNAEGGYLFQGCNVGIDSYTIAWDGKMYACELLNDGYTEPFIIGFQNAWERLPEQYPAWRMPKECNSCKLAGFCDICTAVCLAECGDWFQIPKYVCEETKYLYQVLIELQLVDDGIEREET